MTVIRFLPLGAVLKCTALALLVASCSSGDGMSGGPGSGGSNAAAGGSGSGQATPGSSGMAPVGGDGGSGGLGTVAIMNPQDKAVARLTNSQFIHSVSALMGPAAVVGVQALLPQPVIQQGLFRNTGFAQEQLYSEIQAYDAAATAIVANVTDWPGFYQRYGACTQSSCIMTFVRAFAEAAFRRPVTAAEVAAFQPIVDAATAGALTYGDTVQLIVRATLQSPEFLYLLFDPTLTQFQLAARLSYVITDGPPDATLYAAAKSQQLGTPAAFGAQVDRLLGADLTAFAQAFGTDYLELLKATTRNVNQTATSTPATPAQILQFVDSAVGSFASLVNGNQPIGSILTTDTFVVNPATASWLAGQTSTATTVKPTPQYPFLGLLTHPATLIAMSNAVFGSTVSRGQFISNQVMCVPPTPPPPAGIQMTDLSAVLPPNPTERDYGVARMNDARCSGCHSQFEPYSFALNKWGGDGLFKNDPTLKDDGPIKTGLGNMSFSSYQDFLPQLATSTQFQRCLTDHVVRYGLQHTQYPADLTQTVLTGALGASPNLTFRSLIKALVQQPIFATR